MPALGICLTLAAATSVLPVYVPVERFTLAWTHSIENVRWEEDYAVLPGTPPRLEILAARVRGSAAGMEPPAGAVLRDGWYEYAPPTVSPFGLRLTRSTHTADYDWCTAGSCVSLGSLLPSDGNITLLRACASAASH